MQKIESRTPSGRFRIAWTLAILISAVVGLVLAAPILIKTEIRNFAQFAFFLMVVLGGTGGAASLLGLMLRQRKTNAVHFWQLLRLRDSQDPGMLACRAWARAVLFFWAFGAIGLLLLLLLSPDASCC